MAKKYRKLPKPFKYLVLIIVIISVLYNTILYDIMSDYLRLKVSYYKSFTTSWHEVKKINSIHDGDTINITNENGDKVKIRLYGIDAPELKQEYGENSRKCLEDLLAGKKVSYAVEDTDKYNRTVATLYADNVNINHEMVKEGCAWSYFHYSKSIRNEYAQLKAKFNKYGLWAHGTPQAPWEYRKENKK